jgi:hypothetical protein
MRPAPLILKRLGQNSEPPMRKPKKTIWEKQILRWQITLIVLIPLLFGLAFWFICHLHAYP